MIERRRTCLAFSPGGHYSELERAIEGIEFTNCFLATFKGGRSPERNTSKIYYLCHPRRSIWRTVVNIFQTLLMLILERPKLIISSGADVAVASLVIGKLFGARTIFIESAGSVEPTLSGRLVYPFSDLFIVPWKESKSAFPKAVYARGMLY